MADSIYLDRDYSTNGVTIPARQVSTEDLKQLMPIGQGAKKRAMTDVEAKEMQQELMRRQGRYSEYSKGIHERHEVTHDAGTMAVGGGAE